MGDEANRSLKKKLVSILAIIMIKNIVFIFVFDAYLEIVTSVKLVCFSSLVQVMTKRTKYIQGIASHSPKLHLNKCNNTRKVD